MELYEPLKVLPILKIKKPRERQSMEDDPKVHNFIRSKMLLDQDFNTLYLRVLNKSKELLKLVRTPPEFLRESDALNLILEMSTPRSIKKKVLLEHLWLGKELAPQDKKTYEKTILEIEKKIYQKVRRKVTKLSNEIQNNMSAFDEQKENVPSILSSTTIYVCKKCSKIILRNKFKRYTCTCGAKISRISQVRQNSVHHFNDKLVKFLENNYWFEHGVDYLLRRKSLQQTRVGYYVLGHSGVYHEIDNIACFKRKKYILFCECKNAEVKVSDIFTFSGKMADTGCTRGYVFTTSTNVSDEIGQLASSKNIIIIKDVLTKSIENLLQKIQESSN